MAETVMVAFTFVLVAIGAIAAFGRFLFSKDRQMKARKAQYSQRRQQIGMPDPYFAFRSTFGRDGDDEKTVYKSGDAVPKRSYPVRSNTPLRDRLNKR